MSNQSQKIIRGRCSYLKYFATSMEKKCGNPHGLNSLHIKDATEKFTCDIDICMEDSNTYLNSFMNEEHKIQAEIKKIDQFIKDLPTHVSEDTLRMKKEKIDKLQLLRKKLNIERNEFCRLESCHHRLDCNCDDCKRKILNETIKNKRSQITAFSINNNRRETLMYHQKCLWSAIVILGFDPFKIKDKQQTTLLQLITN